MTTKHALWACTALLALVAGACSTKESPAPDAKTSSLAAHPWRIVAFTTTDAGAQPPTTVNTFQSFPAYRLDDTYRFQTSQDLVFDEGSQKRVAADPQSSDGKWQFRDNQNLLDITLNRSVALGTTGSTATSTYRVLELTDTTLRLEGGSVSQVVVITLAQ